MLVLSFAETELSPVYQSERDADIIRIISITIIILLNVDVIRDVRPRLWDRAPHRPDFQLQFVFFQD